MFIRRCLNVLFYGLLLMAVVLVAGGWLVRTQLKALGVEQLEVSGMTIGWNRVAFDSISVTWTGDGRLVILETLGPALTLDWADWQLDRLVARSARIEQTPTAWAVTSTPAATSSRPGEAFRLSLPDSVPFWLPRHFAVNQLEATFPCQDTQCQFNGALTFDRNENSATARVDATVARGTQSMAVEGDIQLGKDPQTAVGGDLVIRGLGPWLSPMVSAQWQPLLPRSATLRFAPLAGPAIEGQWPMAVTLTTQGGAAPAFEGELILHTGDDWRLDIRRGRLDASLARWQQAGWVLDDIRADLPFTGEFSAAGGRLSLGPGAVVSVRHADPVSTSELVWLDNLAMSAEGLALIHQDGEVQVEGPVEASAGSIRHDSLVTQGWQLKTDVRWDGALVVDGSLENDAGSHLPLQAHYQPLEGLDGQAVMTLNAGNEANHLADTLTTWPGSLTVEEGEAELTARVRWSPDGSLAAMADLDLSDASGLYEQMAWQGLSGRIQADLEEDVLTVETTDLALESLNPGMPLGPVRLAGRYEASLAEPMAGRLALSAAETGFAGGTLSVPPQIWQLHALPIEIPVAVQGLQLSRLMSLYPTEGLAGEGVLDGKLPLIVSQQGVRIENGELSALPPGGQLQLPADRLQAMAAANATMALVAQAMEEFHYERLVSAISYSEEGILMLDLQLRGTSPRVDSDRPVVLNINLEEDIPALLTSLQLSGRVNDAVTERVRERLQQESMDNPQ